MSTYEELFADGERYRMAHQPRVALAPYKAALEMSGNKDRTIKHMIGVCYGMLGDNRQALDWYEQALPGASAFEKGNIIRDKAAARSKLGENGPALALLKIALKHLPYEQHPEHFGITVGFLARTEFAIGDLRSAIKHFEVAEAILYRENNRELQLYNLLPYTNALSTDGHWIISRVWATEACILAYKYGARHHRIRALALFIGGHKLDNYVQKRWPPK